MDKSASNIGPESHPNIPPMTAEKLLGYAKGTSLERKTVDELNAMIRNDKERATLVQTLMEENALVRQQYQGDIQRLSADLDNSTKTLESKEGFFSRAGKFIKRNKWKILLGAIAVGATVAGIGYAKEIKEWGGKVLKSIQPAIKKYVMGAPEVPGVPGVPSVPGVTEGPEVLNIMPNVVPKKILSNPDALNQLP